MENRKYNITNIIAICTFVGSLIGVWRAVEMKAVALSKDIESITQKQKAYEKTQQEIMDKLQGIAIINERTATILDQHLKYHPNPTK